MAKCVVCAAMGMETIVDETKAKQKNMTAEYQGRTYYFDSKEHMRMFEQDPERYLRMSRERGLVA